MRLNVYVCARVRACVCVRARVRARASVGGWVGGWVGVCVCMCAGVCVCVGLVVINRIMLYELYCSAMQCVAECCIVLGPVLQCVAVCGVSMDSCCMIEFF